MLLEPWMLRIDWRENTRPFLLVDLSTWPTEQAFAPLPPIPLLGIGDRSHPQAGRLDMLVEPPVKLEMLAFGIAKAPVAATALIQLLRATEEMPQRAALTAESFAFAMLQGGAEHAAWRDLQSPRATLPPGLLHLVREGNTIDLLIDRPYAHNSIDRAMRDALHEAFQLAVLDGSIAHIRLRGAGRCFSMGAELAEFGTMRDPAAAHMIRMLTLPALPLLERCATLEVHVQGACVGSGLELAAFADRITASPDAWFRLPEVGMGILPGAGGTVSIPRRIGRQRGALLMVSGKRLTARAALDWNLIDAIVDEDTANPGCPDARRGKVGT
ncbi:enoyl-CoA hydratase/isomerase family protein [Sphingobium sp.]|uniref:enoyl-CoA hydratase/isomerase family protein n=1 Tax=Sphingobium sp. TaxID=1912891 RepID=UPI002C41B35B|nr:enoyl-CoA hydratase/isomerase family protein [Sphingobium sp.]HUD89975.1 enoyl-CoA hydratase/isomerase family protein [Sphingobium sp.]